MKVLAATPLYPPASRVGAWLATHACLAHLVKLGHQVDVVTYLNPSAPYAYDGVTVYPCGDLQDFTDADVVISHLGDNQTASRFAADHGIPSVRMVHGANPANSENLAATPYELAVFNSISLAETVDHSAGIVVHPPFDPDQIRSTPGRLVTLVNLCEAKGGRIFWKLAAAMPDVQFLGVQGMYGEQISNKRKNVTMIPATYDMAGDVYSRTRLLLMPSERETWGMTGLEAMCSGIPVIAHPTPGLIESLGSAGTFVDRDDLDGWATAIRHILRPSVWPTASAAALEHASRYDPAPDLFRFAAAIEEVAA